MPTKQDALDFFGRFIAQHLRDSALQHLDVISTGNFEGSRRGKLQRELMRLTPEQRVLVGRVVLECVDSGIHDFLFKLQEQADFENQIQVTVLCQDLNAISDGLQGEPFCDRGWFARFSRYGTSPLEEGP